VLSTLPNYIGERIAYESLVESFLLSDEFLLGKCLTAAGFLPRQIDVIRQEVTKYKGTFIDRPEKDGHDHTYCIVPFDR
jgi:hypothetical protein